MSTNTLKKLRIFVASPSDVASERAKVEAVAAALKPIADYLGLALEVSDWRRVVPDMGRPQQVIFDQLQPTSWDVFIGILWHRFGTPPNAIDVLREKEYLAGTEEEFWTAYRLRQQFGRPRMMMYRCTRQVNLDAIDFEQAKHVKDFFAKFEAKGEHPGLVQSFDTTETFEKLLLDHLQKLLIEYGSKASSDIRKSLKHSVDSSEFITMPVTLSGLANEDLGIYAHPPHGQQEFHGIPFHVENARISMKDVYDGDSIVFYLQEPIVEVRAVHFLINAGDGRKRYGPVTIGCIEFVFKDDVSPASKVEIKLGKNVREWAIGNSPIQMINGQRQLDPLVDSVEDKDISREAWRGTTDKGQVAVIDLLTIQIGESKRDKALTAIRFTRDIPREKYALDYFVSGITVECGP